MSNKPAEFTVRMTHPILTENEIIDDTTRLIACLQEYFSLLEGGILRVQKRDRGEKSTMLTLEFPPNTTDELINDFLWDLKNIGITIAGLGEETVEE